MDLWSVDERMPLGLHFCVRKKETSVCKAIVLFIFTVVALSSVFGLLHIILHWKSFRIKYFLCLRFSCYMTRSGTNGSKLLRLTSKLFSKVLFLLKMHCVSFLTRLSRSLITKIKIIYSSTWKRQRNIIGDLIHTHFIISEVDLVFMHLFF